MAPLTFREALALAKLVDDWGPLMAQMPTAQRNHMKKAFKEGRTRGDIDEWYARCLHEATLTTATADEISELRKRQALEAHTV